MGLYSYKQLLDKQIYEAKMGLNLPNEKILAKLMTKMNTQEHVSPSKIAQALIVRRK